MMKFRTTRRASGGSQSSSTYPVDILIVSSGILIGKIKMRVYFDRISLLYNSCHKNIIRYTSSWVVNKNISVENI